ncbi:MAG: peptidoglycan bridge formation glycyltransferase FemA/FemB family protein [Candidatus Pacebacteria bacterium]|nr:peptidoglycan bridge formation glycyltransferase FemA/FemB family protein [Candidatus Paceibacterota bacterium]
MIIRPIRDDEKELYNQVVNHPLQTWEWGEFRKKTGVKVERIGFFDQGQLKKALQLTFHDLPKTNYTAGYYPKGFEPNEDQLSALRQLGKKHQALFIKLEPNLAVPVDQKANFKQLARFLVKHGCKPGRPLFTKHTFQLDLTQSEEQLFSNLKSKTRYNINLAQKKGVRIIEDSSRQGLQVYLDILQETIDRQGFYAHSPDYFKQMWETLNQTYNSNNHNSNNQNSDQGSSQTQTQNSAQMMKIFHAVYDNMTLASWIIFQLGNTIYYPYGASRDLHRDLMASNLMMWEVIMYGKRQGCQTFDMWGALGPEPDKKHPWYGFHRFKQGYGGELMRFLGTYDLVLNPRLYKLFRIADNLRWKYLRLKTKLGNLIFW